MRLKERNLRAEIAGVRGYFIPEIIESYPEDRYLPSFLVRGEAEGVVFHAHIATDVNDENVRIITMYLPELDGGTRALE